MGHMGQGTVPRPTKKMTIESHSHGASRVNGTGDGSLSRRS